MDNIRTIGIVGTGVIGASWAAYFLAKGFDVRATDPAPDAEANLRKEVAAHWSVLTELGFVKGASQERLVFDADLETAANGCDFVQENGPERSDIKENLFPCTEPSPFTKCHKYRHCHTYTGKYNMKPQ